MRAAQGPLSLRDPAGFDAHGAQVFFVASTQLPAAVICLYLVLVRLGPRG
jgi:hypothetical protein